MNLDVYDFGMEVFEYFYYYGLREKCFFYLFIDFYFIIE